MATTAGCESCVIRIPLFGEINFGRFASSCCGVKPPLETEAQIAAKAAEAEQIKQDKEKARLYDEGRALFSAEGHIEAVYLHQELKRVFKLEAMPAVVARRLEEQHPPPRPDQ